MADKFPESYADPLYASLDAANEQKLELPVGLLQSIRMAGEKSNASQVSSAGATTPYQFTPITRRSILDKFGIDVTLSPENASEGAGLLLRDSLKRGDGDIERAIREYHGGTNPKNWGKVNDAYAARVLAGQQTSKMDALGAGFAKFMQDNPAAPATPSADTAAAPKDDALAAGFGAWLASGAPKTLAAQIPASADENAFGASQPAQPAAPGDPSLVDRVVGGGETALALATGATGGAVGALGGTVKGLAGSVMDGTFGTQQGVRNVERAAAEGMGALTYQPRTAAGQQQTEAVGQAMEAALPVMPLTVEMGAAGRAAGNATQAARDLSAGTVARIRTAAPAIAERVQRTINRNPDRPTPGTPGSVGAAGVDVADQRRALAADLPVPVRLTRGQAERSFEQQRFEREMAKDPTNGEPLRDRYAQQNEDIMKNFDAWVDQTGAEAPSLRAVGQAVDQALVKKAARDKAEIRVAYRNAEKAGELAAPVALDPVIEYLNASAPDAETAPILNAIRKHVVKLGIADEKDGHLVPAQTEKPLYAGLMNAQTDQPGVTLKTAETLRQAINRATDYEPTNIRQATIIKGLIDSATENAGGDLYRAARRLRENFAKQYEDRAVVAKLLNTKKGMADRQVALEDIWNHVIQNGSMDDVRHVRRVLQTGGDEGQQAWRELQGQTLTWIKDEATKNVATDTRGNPIVSADKLNKAIRSLDADGKLDFLFGKHGAQQLRDINDLTKVVFTSPPGAINSSNTASVLLAALAEAGATGSVTGIPVPILSSLRIIAKQVKNRQIQKRIEQALNHRASNPPAPPTEFRPRGATLH